MANDPLMAAEVTGIWLRGKGDQLQVLAEVEGRWRLVIEESIHDARMISHIVEPSGIARAEVVEE